MTITCPQNMHISCSSTQGHNIFPELKRFYNNSEIPSTGSMSDLFRNAEDEFWKGAHFKACFTLKPGTVYSKARIQTLVCFNYCILHIITKKLSRSLCIAERIKCFSIFNSLECFPWKLLSYCTGPRNVLSYCTGPRKGVPGGTSFARWSPLKKYLAAICLSL